MTFDHNIIYQNKFFSCNISIDSARWREIDWKITCQRIKRVFSQRLKLEIGQDDGPASHFISKFLQVEVKNLQTSF